MLILSYRMLAVAIVAAALASCATQATPERYKAASTALEGSAALRAKTIAHCVQHKWRKETIENLALLLDVSESKAPALGCQRVINGVASGRLTYEDFEKTRRGDITAKVVKVLQGR